MKPRMDEVKQGRRIRGDILLYVRTAGAIGTTRQYLQLLFRQSGRGWALDTLDEHCRYLVDSGYLRWEHLRDATTNVEREIYSLTITGVELLLKTIPPDPEVAIVR